MSWWGVHGPESLRAVDAGDDPRDGDESETATPEYPAVALVTRARDPADDGDREREREESLAPTDG
ncbi:hypothetical protein NGM10_10495 [Halorussus salilacus]|uniref:hypothetical protein n=1 Tax=Halorussus salilacus TaxID=2953750 RepID=UPI0020A04D66|nr:hypothetical protein [Halorussus salilacus]USZ67159.1 hypothetical protein NGM10_10495 [Halorussus salilacus]